MRAPSPPSSGSRLVCCSNSSRIRSPSSSWGMKVMVVAISASGTPCGTITCVDELWSVHLGRVPYAEALALQQRVRAARQRDLIPDTVLTLEHAPAVYTRGRRSDPAELPFTADWYAERGIEIVDVDRGGKVTYHGPGQLVAYPIVGVADVMDFVQRLERVIADALAEEGIDARGRAHEGRDLTGVWVGDRKIGSIGLHISHGVTMH